jgi:uncharacterized protein
MLHHTFIHIQGIGEKTERHLWRNGIRTWDDYLGRSPLVFPKGKDGFIREELENSITHLDQVGFFAERLPSFESWRLYDSFKSRTVYLDIETSGGYAGVDEITVIGMFDGLRMRSFVSGIDLGDFEGAIADFDLIVTFNGACFDLPFIRRTFPNISLPLGHIDLRYPLKRLGYRGGLKKIEKEMGIVRQDGIDGMNGYDAVRLWREYQWGDRRALEVLLEYNRADVLNMELLMERVNRELKAKLLPVEWRDSFPEKKGPPQAP